MLEAAPKNKQVDVLKLITSHIGARGDTGYLESLLTLGGSFNPFDAFPNLRLKKVDFNRTPQIDKKRSTNKRKVHVPIAKTERSKSLVHGAIYLTSQKNPSESVIIGFQAYNKLNNIFGFTQIEPLIQNKDQREKQQKSLEEQTRREYAKSVEEIKNGLKNLTDIQSIYERQKVQTLTDFNTVVDDAMKLMGTLILNQDMYVNGDFATLFSSRGTLLTSIVNDDSVDKTIKSYAVDLLDPNIQIPHDEYIFKFNLVRSYKAMMTPINTEKVLGHYIDDLKIINALPDSYFEEADLLRPNAAKVADVISSKTTTLLNAGRFENLGIQDIRFDLGDKVLQSSNAFEYDYLNALAHTRFLFRENDSWKLDGVKSVPLRSDFKNYMFTAILNQHELRLLMDVQYSLFASQDDSEKFMASNSISSFRAYANQLVVIERKLSHLGITLLKKGAPRTLEEDSSGELVSYYKDYFKNDRNGQFVPNEYFLQEYGVSLDDVLTRWFDVKSHISGKKIGELETQRQILDRDTKKGYISKKRIDELAEMYSYNSKPLFEGLADLSELGDVDIKNQETVSAINKSPLVRSQIFLNFSRTFLLPDEKEDFAGYDSVKEELESIADSYTAEIIDHTVSIYGNLMKEEKGRYNFKSDSFRIRTQTWILDGEVNDANQLVASKDSITGDAYETTHRCAKYISSSGFKNLVEKVSSLSSLGNDLLRKIHFLASHDAKSEFSNLGIQPVSKDQWSTLKNCRVGDYITHDFAETVIDLYNQMDN